MKNKGITIAALIVAVIGLSIGFAAFSNTLTIRSTATVTPDASTMRVVFSKESGSEVAGNPNTVSSNNSTYGDPGTIDNSTQGNSILKDLHAKFTAPGQSVKYNLYVVNVGSINGQITGVTFNNAQGVSTYKKCTAVTKQDTTQIATDSLVQSACNGINITVKVGQITATPQNPDLTYQLINVRNYLPVEVTISYDYGAAYVDGDMDVVFGDIQINVSSAVDSTLVPTNPWVLRGLTSPNVTVGSQYSLDSGESAGCILYTTFANDGSLADSRETISSTQIDSMTGASFIAGPDYVLLKSGYMYVLYEFPQVGKMTRTSSSMDLPFNKSAIESAPSSQKTVCHYTSAQS